MRMRTASPAVPTPVSYTHLLGCDDDGHALLRFGDRKLRAGQALVFFRQGVEVDFQAVGQLADGDGDAAGAEIVAAFDAFGNVGAAEKPLKLALLGGVALLNLGCLLYTSRCV